MQVLSPDFSRYLSHSFTIPSHAQGHNDAHGACAAGLPGICDVNLVSHTMGDGISSVAWSRGVSKPEKPTQGAPARAECPAPRRNPSPQRAQHAKRTGLLMTDASHRMDKPAPPSVALYLPPFSHTGCLPTARTPSWRPTQNSNPLSRRFFSLDKGLFFEALVLG